MGRRLKWNHFHSRCYACPRTAQRVNEIVFRNSHARALIRAVPPASTAQTAALARPSANPTIRTGRRSTIPRAFRLISFRIRGVSVST